jgi:drug/metabolite transporter (DMT)-like permease
LHLNRNILLLHFTVLIWGFTAILGALITIPAMELVWWRMLIAAVSLFTYLVYKKQTIILEGKNILKLTGIGGIVALHWIFFFYSIKISSISVALVCLSATALFTSFLSPLINRKKISVLDFAIGIVIIIGIYLIFHFETRYTEGIIFGLLTALLASIFTIINEKQIKNRDAVIISFYEMIGGFLIISIYLLATYQNSNYSLSLSLNDFIYLFLLGTVCTAFAYVTGVMVMKELSAFTVVLTTNLEPVYGILMAFVFFGTKERMTTGFYIGSLIILSAVFVYPVIKKRLKNSE